MPFILCRLLHYSSHHCLWYQITNLHFICQRCLRKRNPLPPSPRLPHERPLSKLRLLLLLHLRFILAGRKQVIVATSCHQKQTITFPLLLSIRFLLVFSMPMLQSSTTAVLWSILRLTIQTSTHLFFPLLIILLLQYPGGRATVRLAPPEVGR